MLSELGDEMKKAVLQKPSSDPNGIRALFVPNTVPGTSAQDSEVLSQGTASGGAEKPTLKNPAE